MNNPLRLLYVVFSPQEKSVILFSLHIFILVLHPSKFPSLSKDMRNENTAQQICSRPFSVKYLCVR